MDAPKSSEKNAFDATSTDARTLKTDGMARIKEAKKKHFDAKTTTPMMPDDDDPTHSVPKHGVLGHTPKGTLTEGSK